MEERSSPQLFHTSILYTCRKKGNTLPTGRVWGDLPSETADQVSDPGVCLHMAHGLCIAKMRSAFAVKVLC